MADSSYNTYVSPIGRFQAIQGNRLANEAQRLQNEQAPIRAGLMKQQARGIELGNQDAERLMGQAEEQYRTTDIAARAFQLSRMDDQSMMEGLRQQMPDFAAAAAQNNATPQQVRERLGGIAQYAAMKGYVKLPEAAKQRFTQPIEVTGPDGQPMLVQQDPQTGQLVPVQGYKPALGSTETIEMGPDGVMRISRGKGASGGGNMERSVSGDLQKKIVGSERMLVRLDEVMQNYDPRILTYWGQAQNAAAKTMDKLGMELAPEQRELLQRAVQTKEGINQIYNDYRREITGAAASVQELSSLKLAVLNTSQSPEQFAAAVERFRTQVQNDIKLYQRFLSNGFTPEQAGKALDATKPEQQEQQLPDINELTDEQIENLSDEELDRLLAQ